MCRIEKNGYVLHLEGTWMEISNKYGVQKHGDMAVDQDSIPEGFAEKTLDEFIEAHTVSRFSGNKDCIKKVVIDEESKKYVQLQTVRKADEIYMVQIYDTDLVFMREQWSGCRYVDEVKDWMKSNFEIVSGLPVDVYKSGYGDCTNHGISSSADRLYLLAKGGYPFEPNDIRECVIPEPREVMGKQYLNAKPIYHTGRWYMAGGNFIYTSDSRYKDITGLSYPIAIHDRYEGSED